MWVAIFRHGLGLAMYYGEMLQTWGLRQYRFIQEHELRTLDVQACPVLVCPAGELDADVEQAIASYVEAGGTLVAMCPGERLVGLAVDEVITRPLRFRASALEGVGLAAEPLPVVGTAHVYSGLPEEAQVLAHLSETGLSVDVGPAIFHWQRGRGRIVVVAFDLAWSVLLCRQGDPKLAGRIPPHAPEGFDACRAVNMVVDMGPGGEPAGIPFADLIARVFVEVVRRALPGPWPLLWHLPGKATGLVVYSGDEDNADVHVTQQQMDSVARMGGKMNLYIIPEITRSTPAEYARWRERHHLGPHPNLRNHDAASMAEKLDEFTRQIKLFERMTGCRARTLRNHHVVWIGYMEQAQRMAEMGIRMDGNYNYGSLMRSRDPGPFAGWGAGMPMRFCTPEGKLIDVMQQHTHVGDDEYCSTHPRTSYSYRITPAVYEAVVHQVLSDAAHRFHVPYAVNIHPGNWGVFSRGHSDVLLQQAAGRDMPVYSFDQWSVFWDQRDTWRVRELAWQDGELSWRWEGQAVDAAMSGTLPAVYEGRRLLTLEINGQDQPVEVVRRHLQATVCFDIPQGQAQVRGRARYEV